MSVVVLAQMSNDGDHTGNWWLVLGIGWLVLFLAVLAVVLVRRFNERKAPRRRAEDLLAERLAQGEIDEDEYRRRREALRD
jgi:putative membrane protein